jgi:hypothetical protein
MSAVLILSIVAVEGVGDALLAASAWPSMQWA